MNHIYSAIKLSLAIKKYPKYVNKLLFGYRVFSSQTILTIVLLTGSGLERNLDPSCKTGLNFWNYSGGVKPLITGDMAD